MNREHPKAQPDVHVLVQVLVLGSPFLAVIVGYMASTNGHLRNDGGLALGVTIVLASMAVSGLLIGFGDDPPAAWVWLLPAIGLGSCCSLGVAIYVAHRGWRRRLLFGLAGLLAPAALFPFLLGVGVFYLLPILAACGYLAIKDPPLRTSEPGPTPG